MAAITTTVVCGAQLPERFCPVVLSDDEKLLSCLREGLGGSARLSKCLCVLRKLGNAEEQKLADLIESSSRAALYSRDVLNSPIRSFLRFASIRSAFDVCIVIELKAGDPSSSK